MLEKGGTINIEISTLNIIFTSDKNRKVQQEIKNPPAHREGKSDAIYSLAKARLRSFGFTLIPDLSFIRPPSSPSPALPHSSFAIRRNLLFVSSFVSRQKLIPNRVSSLSRRETH